ncbi:hypothetical protein K439DRAFT_1638077 [Ramaria rubella]|nr:hypothetical protein K439DRAFT_1638077 [Ramaria rubella]
MLCRYTLLTALGLFVALGASASAVGSPSRAVGPRDGNDEPMDMTTPSSHPHNTHHPEPLLELNETEILRWHAPDPLSYWSHDFEILGETNTNWRGLMGLHTFGMCLAFFILLPVGISLRSVKSRWHGAAVVAFTIVAAISSIAGSLYKKLTGDLYEGSVHGRGGFLVLALAAILTICDSLSFFRRALAFLRRPDRRNIRLFLQSVVLNQIDRSAFQYASLVREETDEYIEAKLLHEDLQESDTSRFSVAVGTSRTSPSEWVNGVQQDWPQSAASHSTFVNPLHGRHPSFASNHSDDTLHNPSSFHRTDSNDIHDSHEQASLLSRIWRAAFSTAEHCLVILAFTQLLSGITVYTGICRQYYINGCMAHLIKGSIFWCYGLLTFARYLGAWASLGWAWNRLPAPRAQRVPSAEAVESFVIFLYGATNVWMERFGAIPGSPFTTKQLQHISIAVMFWFAGMLGLALESRTLRRWLSSPVQSAIKSNAQVAQPPSYSGSFNPFPALVIGVTGVAMSAHHQTYLFQVQIHALWGFFLAGFAVLRCLTYFFLWLRPPHSVLPSRPPTEAMASFFLACGGMTFIFSTEQITFAAMRRQMDDVMFIFNFTVALTCLAFCWVMSIVSFKAWAVYRNHTTAPCSILRKSLFHDGS